MTDRPAFVLLEDGVWFGGTSPRALEAADKVREESGGRLAVEVYPNSQLGGDTQMLAQLRSGALELMQIGDTILANVVPAADPRDWKGLDLLGVVDLDDDGRPELIFAYHYADRHTWAIYSPQRTAAGLDLVGEGVPWQ